MEADGTLFVDGMLLNEMLKMGNRRNRGADLKTPEMPRWRARDLSFLVHARDPRHREQEKKERKYIHISGLFTVCVREREYGLCVY